MTYLPITDIRALPSLDDLDCLSTYLLLLGGSAESGIGVPVVPGGITPCADSILQEDGSYILQEDGLYYICQESGAGEAITYNGGFLLSVDATSSVDTTNSLDGQKLHSNGSYYTFYARTEFDYDVSAFLTGAHNVRCWFQPYDSSLGGPSVTLVLNANGFNISNLADGTITPPATIAVEAAPYESGDLFKIERISASRYDYFHNGALIYSFDASAVAGLDAIFQVRFKYSHPAGQGETYSGPAAVAIGTDIAALYFV